MERQLPPGYTVRKAADHTDFKSFARLAVQYHAWLNVDLCFQDFEHELASLPGSYAEPSGCILLVSCTISSTAAPEDVACVAVRPLKQQKQRPARDVSYDSIAAAAEQLPSMHQQECRQHQQDTPGTLRSSDVCELKRLWVQEPHQRNGLARILMAAALQASAASLISSVLLQSCCYCQSLLVLDASTCQSSIGCGIHTTASGG
jgi:GNAT superfamily N-acetyltransferase